MGNLYLCSSDWYSILVFTEVYEENLLNLAICFDEKLMCNPEEGTGSLVCIL